MIDDAVFVIDSSGVIAPAKELLAQQSKQAIAQVYGVLEDLVDDERLFFPHQVFDEIEYGFKNAKQKKRKASDPPYQWCSVVREWAAPFKDAQVIDYVVEVLKRCPTLVDPDARKTPEVADPYVVGLALSLREQLSCNVVVITEDMRDKANVMSLQTACAVHGIHALSTRAFLHYNDIWTEW